MASPKSVLSPSCQVSKVNLPGISSALFLSAVAIVTSLTLHSVGGSVILSAPRRAFTVLAYGDVYCVPTRAKYYLRQPWLNIT